MSDEKRRVYWMRPMGIGDLPTISRWFEDLTDLAMFDRGSHVPPSPDAFEKSWREDILSPEPRKSCWFAIDDEEGAIVGIVGLENISYANGDAVLPACLARRVRGQGIAIRATALVIDLAFDQLRLNRVTTYLRDDNEVSKHLTEIAGFSEEGRMRQAWFTGGQHVDMLVMGILKTEWLKHRPKLVQRVDDSTVVILGKHPDSKFRWPPSGGEPGAGTRSG